MPTDLEQRLSVLAEHWLKIEGRLKEAEILRTEVVVPAINELRYAGRRMVLAWKTNLERDASGSLAPNQEKAFQESLVAAQAYLWNADDDITDAICSHASDRVRRVLETHGIGIVSQFFPGIHKFYDLAKDSEKKRIESRNNYCSRRDVYNNLADNHVPHFLKYITDLHDAEVKSLTHMKLVEKKERVWQFISLLSLLFGVLGFFSLFV